MASVDVHKIFTPLDSEDDRVAFNKFWTTAPSREFAVNEVVEIFPSSVEGPLALTVNRLIVLDDYFRLLKTALSLASHRPSGGLIINGTPGIGKTMSLWYLLVCLLNMKQTVLFTLGKETTLFHNGQVFECKHDCLTQRRLPILPRGKTFWSLIDMENVLGDPPPALTCLSVFPVHVTSPDSIRNYRWQRARTATMRFMSLWTRDELLLGLKLCDYFPVFHKALEVYLQHKTIPEDKNSNIALAIAVAKSILDRQKAIDAADDNSRSDDLDVEKALGVLVDNATELYGFAPRDVHGAIFYPSTIQIAHNVVESLSFDALTSICRSFNAPAPTPPYTAHEIIAIEPVWTSPFDPKDTCSPDILPPWYIIKFKSRDIAQRANFQVLRRSHENAQDLFLELCMGGSTTASLAGWASKYLAHGALARGGNFNRIPMERTRDSSVSAPIFKADASGFGIPHKFPRRNMEIVDLQASISEVTLNENTYYVSQARNNALFDAFAIEFHYPTITTLWILQIATSTTTHRGSDKGYRLIRKITQNLRIMKGKQVEVLYVMVCSPPADPSGRPFEDDSSTIPTGTRHWKMPDGWNLIDHKPGFIGPNEVFCLILPTKAMPGSVKKRKRE